MCPILYLSIHQDLLTSTHLLFELSCILPFLLHNLVKVCHRITWFPLFCSMFFFPMFLERIVTWKLLLTRRANRWLPGLGSWRSMLPDHMIVHFLLIVKEVITIRTRSNSCSTSFSMSSCMRPNIHVSTVPTMHFLVSIQRRQLKNGRIIKYYYKESSTWYISKWEI